MYDDTSVLWDQLGQPCCFIKGDWIFALNGQSLGFIDRQGAVFTMKRVHIAWFEGGVLRDQRGQCLALAETPTATVHPPHPHHRFPAPMLPQTRAPLSPPVAAGTSPKPHEQYLWSPLNFTDLFR
jgi:hypothetical protein